MPHKNEDNGRFNVTRKNSDKHKFKVPSLRNVELTYPYMHDGNVKSLQEAVRIMAEYQVGKKLSDEETTLIVKFLKTLTGTQHSAPQPSALPEPANGAEAAVTGTKSPAGASKARKL
jgi:cytochrome c peroxidase